MDQRNKRHWKVAVASVVLALSSIAVCAFAGQQQGGPRGGMRGGGPERELQMLTERLALTADQQTGVKAVLEQQSTQMKALRQKSDDADSDEARQAQMAQMKQIRDESDTKINALLDDSQKKIFASMLAQRKARMERRGQGGQGGDGPPPPPDGGGTPPQK
jgi:periplasmic protein CpxP/Spy